MTELFLPLRFCIPMILEVEEKEGDFDWVSRGTFVPEFDRIAFSIKEGELSQVFETEYGFHILELFERRGDQYRGRHILLIPKISDIEVFNAKRKT